MLLVIRRPCYFILDRAAPPFKLLVTGRKKESNH
jgi:hypothetical protein